jgi:hypothetical protein
MPLLLRNNRRRARVAARRPRPFQFEQLESRLALADFTLRLDGVDDHLRVLNVPVPTNQMTVEAWIYRNETNRSEQILAGVTSGSFDFYLSSGKLTFSPNAPSSEYVLGTTVIPANIWTHVAATWKFGGQQRLYINGDLEFEGPAGAAPLPVLGTDTISVGAWLRSTEPTFDYVGGMSEVRMWDVERTQNELRQTMNLALEEKLPGLVFDLHLRDNFADSVRGLTVQNHFNAAIVGSNPPTPALPPAAQVDANFNQLTVNDQPVGRYGAGTVYMASTNQAILLGGYVGFAEPSTHIIGVDAGSGKSTLLGQLPAGRAQAAAAYASNADKIYIFGGWSVTGGQLSLLDTIASYQPSTGAVTTLAARLPVALNQMAAVYHPRLGKIVLFGGQRTGTTQNDQSAVYLFDPMTETIQTAPFTLPSARRAMAAVYHPITDRIYYFGGATGAWLDIFGGLVTYNDVTEINFSADGASGSATVLAGVTSPARDFGQSAIYDPHTQLVYLLGGWGTEHVLAFDPLMNGLWRTMTRLPRGAVGDNGLFEGARLNQPYSSVVFSPRNRHAVVMGGGGAPGFPFDSLGTTFVWRVPLGSGAAVPIERWDFPAPLGVPVSSIDGDDKLVAFGTGNGGAPGGTAVAEINADGSRVNLGTRWLGGSHDFLSVNDVKYDAGSDRLWVAASEVGAFRLPGNSGIWDWHVGAGQIGTNRIWSTDHSFPAFGTDRGLFIPHFGAPGYGQYWVDPSADNTNVNALATSPQANGLWGITKTQDFENAGPPQLRQFWYDFFLAPNEFNYGSVCGANDGLGKLSDYKDLVFDPTGNLWIVGTGRSGVDGNRNDKAVCYIPHDNIPAGANQFFSLNGEHAVDVDVDAEGRIWVAFESANAPLGYGVESGGLTVWESKSDTGTTTTDYNWQNAPIGSRRLLGNFGGHAPVWDSGFTAVAGVDEKVWASRGPNGELATVAQRWQQADHLKDTVIDDVFTARGRTFFTTWFGTYTLQPDGVTWDLRYMAPPHVVFGDSVGNTWMEVAGSVQHYLPNGWDTLADRAGAKPTGGVYAIAESRDENPNDRQPGPIWIGGQNGLTLFDRNRFVGTFTPANSPLPSAVVTALLVDRQDRLWVGTDSGVALLSADRASWTTFSVPEGLPNGVIFDLAELGDGQIAISTANGLSLYNPGAPGFITQSPPVVANNLPLTVDEAGRLWAGSAVLTVNGWKGYWYTNSGLKHSTISDNAADGADRVWFSHAPNPGVSVRGAYLPPLKDFQPTITSFTPRYQTSGQNVVITGTSFGGRPDEVRVTLGDDPVDIVSVSNSRLEVRVDDNTTSGVVTVTRGGRNASYGSDAAGNSFCAVPQIEAFSPLGANVGMEVSITGTNFDSDATLRVGDGPARKPHVVSPTHIRFIVEATDGSGPLQILNHCAGATASSLFSFRKINVSIPSIVPNQGMPGEVVEDKVTLIQNYISAGGSLGLGEIIEIDEVEQYITDPQGLYVRYRTQLSGDGMSPPRIKGTTPSDDEKISAASSYNVKNVYFGEAGLNTVRTVLLRRGRTVAEATTTVNVTPNATLQVLLVPIINSTSELEPIKNITEVDLEPVRKRVFPFGTVNFAWSEEAIPQNFSFELQNPAALYDAGRIMDRIRRRYNDGPLSRPDAQIVMGVVAPSLVAPTSDPGFAFWADVSKLLNTIILDDVDTLCDAVHGVVNTLTLGLLGSDEGCQLDIPLYVGWVTAVSPASTLAHEIGHQLGLVKPWAANGSWSDNFSHSVNDELPRDVECNNRGMSWDWNRSFYNKPGVRLPIVDPIRGTEFPPTDDGNPNNALRAKALMSYACAQDANNSFFEPVDNIEMFNPLIPAAAHMIQLAKLLFDTGNSPSAGASPSATALSPEADPPASATAPAPDTTGPRLHVFGTLNTAAGTGELTRVETYGQTGPLTPSFATGYWLVQLDGAGNELTRTGVAPLGLFDDDPSAASQFVFSATLRRHVAATRIELRQGTTVLDSFAPGGAVPVVQIVQPATSVFYDLGPAVVQWNATDADGDPLEVSIEYTPDNGVSWRSIGSASGSGSLSIPIHRLAIPAGGQGRFRVTASDGLRAASATSFQFQIANQPPQVSINTAFGSGTLLEGTSVSLTATAIDGEDGPLDGASVRWDSNRDGTLGTGTTLSTAALSVGSHAITVWAFDQLGWANSATIQLTVVGDYDFDGISDADESASALNLLSPVDAYSDADGDGLILLVERQIGSNPTRADSDGDGRRDDQEFVAGTSSTAVDPPPAADSLSATVSELTLTIDLAAGTPLPQFNVGVLSRQPVDWQLITDVDWLEATAATGITPASTLVRVQAYKLGDGQHTARLRFDSATIGDSAIIPVTVTVVNRQAYFDIDGNGTADGTDCQAIQSKIGLNFGDAGYDLDLDVDRDGRIESEDVGTCQIAVSPMLPGDFDNDGDVDDHDIDLLLIEIAAATHQARFDLTGDALVNAADSTRLVEGILHTHFGDANLDGFVNRADAAILSRNFGWNGGPAWARGNFNGDARVNLVDLAMQQANFGRGPSPSPGVAAPAAEVAKLVTNRDAIRPNRPYQPSAATLGATRDNRNLTPIENSGRAIQAAPSRARRLRRLNNSLVDALLSGM